MELLFRAKECRLQRGITQCLPSTQNKWTHPAFTWFTYPHSRYNT